MKEKEIEISILEYLNKQDIFAWKVKTVGTFDPVKKQFRRPSKYYITGQPDISCVLPGGLYLGIEVKSKIGKVSAHQKLFHERLKNAGAKVLVARSVEDVIAFLKAAA